MHEHYINKSFIHSCFQTMEDGGPTLTSAVNAAAARNRPSGERAAMVFFSWLVSTVPTHFPFAACQSFISVPTKIVTISCRLRQLHQRIRRKQGNKPKCQMLLPLIIVQHINFKMGRPLLTFRTGCNNNASITTPIVCSSRRKSDNISPTSLLVVAAYPVLWLLLLPFLQRLQT